MDLSNTTLPDSPSRTSGISRFQGEIQACSTPKVTTDFLGSRKEGNHLVADNSKKELVNSELIKPSTSSASNSCTMVNQLVLSPENKSSESIYSDTVIAETGTDIGQLPDDISYDEINRTVMEEDVFYSKKDAISVSFDTRKPKNTDSFRNVMSVQPVSSAVLLAPDVSLILQKRAEDNESAPPCLKKVRFEPVDERREKPLELFISANDKENADNKDPKWLDYEKLTSNEMRYNLIKNIWRNSLIPNSNSNLSSYNWRTNNRLSPLDFRKSASRNNYGTVGGRVEDIFMKARDNARYIFEQKVRALDVERDARYDEADDELYYAVSRTDPKFRHHFYKQHREVMDSIQQEYFVQLDILHQGLTDRMSSLDTAQEEVTTVSNFYRGLVPKTSENYFTPHQIECWYDREDLLSTYEAFYSENN